MILDKKLSQGVEIDADSFLLDPLCKKSRYCALFDFVQRIVSKPR